MTVLFCPLCNKLISTEFPVHDCDKLESDEYFSEKRQMRLLWHPDFGWRSYTPEGDVIEDLSFQDVVGFVHDGDFIPVFGEQYGAH